VCVRVCVRVCVMRITSDLLVSDTRQERIFTT